MRKILKPACILAAVMLTVSLMPDSASAGRRCGNSCGSSCGNSCGRTCGTSCGATCAVQANVGSAPVMVSNNGVASGMAQAGTRVQYQSAFQAPVNSAPMVGPMVTNNNSNQPIYLNGIDTVSDRGWRNNWELQNRADRKIRGL
ncbi:MAG: hypothetical protein JWM11_15 [Planctomycetaceae bacterium]|nr:hypothetical protein [Planctomycetaceae bacterium]